MNGAGAMHAAHFDAEVAFLQALVQFPTDTLHGDDAPPAALTASCAHDAVLRGRRSAVPGITHPHLNAGCIEGGSNTSVVPCSVVSKPDRRMIPREDPVAVAAKARALIEEAVAARPGVRVDILRLPLARAPQPLPGCERLAKALRDLPHDLPDLGPW